MYSDDELTYVQQLEKSNSEWELAVKEAEATLHDQDKTIDALSVRIAKLQQTVFDLVEMMVSVTQA
jgi:uncharacterized coiled-coil protein SlyX